MEGMFAFDSFTREQLISAANDMRKGAGEAPGGMAPHPSPGREMILPTEAGNVRVLAHNMDKAGKLPVFVNLHGGGFVLGNADSDDAFMPAIADGANVRVINADYSLAPENPFPKALEEVYAVLKYIKRRADELGIDPNRISVGGHSAGGNLTAAVCLMDSERKELDIRCAILDYPPLDLYTDGSVKPQPTGAIPPEVSRLFDACYHNDREGRKNPLISPLFASDEQLRTFPPTLIITAEYDSLCKEAEQFSGRLENVNVDVKYKCFKGCCHGFTHQNSPEAEQAWNMMICFLRDHA